MAAQSAALAAWTELNDRQQGTLAAIYALDQENEQCRRQQATAGFYDGTPAAEWRQIDFAHEPSDRRMFGITELQRRLAGAGWDNQGNGSTMAALADRTLITRSTRGTTFGTMHTVAMTRQGRAAARTGTSTDTGTVVKASLGRRSWEVLALLWSADRRGQHLDWTYSKTIEFALIKKHIPPLAEELPHGGGYRITERGRDFYRQQHAVHTAAHPDVRAPHPDGAEAEPWPPRADEILGMHRSRHQTLARVWRDSHEALRSAEKEAAAEPPAPAADLPAAVATLVAARHQLWKDTARQRAALAAEHVTDLEQRVVHAARAYAAATLAAFHAAVTRADPLLGLHEPTDDAWDEPPLALPAECGIYAIDAEVKKLHAAAVGRPFRRRGPARKPPRHKPDGPPPPGANLAALAEFLHNHARGGELHRRLHAATPPVQPS